jgi:hypothetical protein
VSQLGAPAFLGSLFDSEIAANCNSDEYLRITGPETKQLGAARDEASCVVKSLGRSEGASVVVRIIVEPCGGLHYEIGVPRKEWRHVHDG